MTDGTEGKSDIAVVLTNARQLRSSFGKVLGALIVLVALFVASKRRRVVGILSLVAVTLVTCFQIWLKLKT
jgi:hypothetical protein